ncbi:flippase-like domain-containing protein [Mucilaginibacter sp. BJC16-A38]|uniref:lysylphosphatidylglycerol synthase transmembrane domain-containing protein n=1 Tax=Mucilaginibacter phenanthrenivorans TaxID=1234842 RepID=UPI002157B298|nr:lysylphosphatidylglycerol synthase transmembrane domain-containing protein [Mucilaginibacter phenanthrenivorans]MCR8560747.1 flippase-like domain-containing protein [Mucilaginibacter phenanthrenivorans]
MTNEEQAITDEVEVLKYKTTKQKIWNVAKLVLKIGVTTVLLVWVFSKVDINSVKYRLLHPKYWLMYGAAILCFFFSMIVSAWRLLSFFKSIGLNLNPKYNLRLYFLGMFYNILLPGGIGGDGYKMYLINKTYKIPVKRVFWAVMFDRLSGLWAIALIATVFVFLIPQISSYSWLAFAAFLVISLVYYFVVHRFFRDYTKYFFQAHGKALILQSLQLLTIACVILSQPDFYQAGFHGEFSPYLLSFLISGFAILIPTAGGAGAREAFFTVMAKVFPMKPDLAVLLATSFYLISLIVAFLGLYYVIRPSRLHDGFT